MSTALLLRAAVLLVVGSALGIAVNAFRATPIPLGLHQPALVCEGGADPVDELGPEEAERLCTEGQILIADVRQASRFEAGHIAGALHLPCSDALPDTLRAATDATGIVLVYGDSTEEARPVAQSLRARVQDRARVAILRGGFPAWSGSGLACESGVCAHCGGDVH